MPKIRIDINTTPSNGRSLTFKAPADCSAITGLIIYYPDGDTLTSKEFNFVDAHGVDVGSDTMSLFSANSLVKVILDTDNANAYVQNADTNAYLERRFAEMLPKTELTIAVNDILAQAKTSGSSVSWASAGIDFNSLPTDTWVKVSNAVVTMEDLAGITESDPFFTWVAHSEEGSILQTVENVDNPLNLITDHGNGTVTIWVIDQMGNSYHGVEFRPDGVYFYTGCEDDYRAYPVSVTIPGFGKFETATTLDSKYFPEGLQTETITLSDTVMIDSVYDENGYLDASKCVGKEMLSYYIKVTNESIYPKSFDFDSYTNGYYLGEGTDGNGIYHIFTAEEIKDGFYRVWDTDENGNSVHAGYCASNESAYDPGLYLCADRSQRFTFMYGAIFETRTPKPIDKKYLPEDIGGMPEVTAEDNGKFLRVVNGKAAWVTVNNAEGVSF